MKKLLGFLKIYGIMFIGACSAALGVSLFLAPANIVSGGLSGIGILVHRFTGFPVGTLILLLNIPLFLIGFKYLGNGFLLRSVFGAFVFSLLIDIAAWLSPITENVMLCAIFGGALLGIGMGIIFLYGATTGGTDIIAQLLYKLCRHIDVGKWLLIVDGFIILLSGILTGNWENCLYGIISAVINGILVDMMIQGANFAKTVYIISRKPMETAEEILSALGRGVTGLYCKKMYTKTEGIMLLCVIKKHEIPKLEQIVLRHDPNSFIIFSGARSVSGEGFKIYPIH
ncbi:MAG: YitT family protein [Ruminococcaceae bacterium]|nr:YitT family protein [Oscillospiraceae bacterium]